VQYLGYVLKTLKLRVRYPTEAEILLFSRGSRPVLVSTILLSNSYHMVYTTGVYQQGVELTVYLQLASRLKICGVIPPLLHTFYAVVLDEAQGQF
jgi:hypothetical protein